MKITKQGTMYVAEFKDGSGGGSGGGSCTGYSHYEALCRAVEAVYKSIKI